MTLPVVFRRAARREFDEAALWYEERRAGLGHNSSEINYAINWCWKNPQRTDHAPRDSMCSSAPLPYSVFFHNQALHRRLPCFMRPYQCGTTAHRMRKMIEASDQLGLA
jgi:hypothetical protein